LDDLFLEDRLARFFVGGAKYTDPTWATDGHAFQESSNSQKVRSNLVKPGSHTNTSLTAGPSLLALGLMYLKTGNVDVADRIAVPETLFLLSYIRPDLLLLRCLSRSLILWNNVEPTEVWMKSHIPRFIWRFGDPETGRTELNAEMADDLPRNRDFNLLVHCKMYCVAGCALGLGITRAGTQDASSRALLLSWLKKLATFRKSCSEVDLLVSESCLMTVCVAAAVVMAGSGDLELTRWFRLLSLRVDASIP
jgi:anaphase-promoting complex subunit 1